MREQTLCAIIISAGKRHKKKTGIHTYNITSSFLPGMYPEKRCKKPEDILNTLSPDLHKRNTRL